MKRISLAIATVFLLLGFCVSANAQYVWVDKDNTKHYSDQPPPASVPNNRILKTPGNKPAVNINETLAEPAASEPKNSDSPAAKNDAPMTTAEKNADFNKRKIEQAEKDKKADEEKKRADAKASNCERARRYQKTLDAGDRIARPGKDGEREYLNDEDRAKESQAVQESLKDCN
jgi:hypothetical protein